MPEFNPFDPKEQEQNLDAKLITAIAKMSDLFRENLWRKTQPLGISPIQFQFLLYIDSHPSDLTTVSHLALKYGLTKATVSDSIKLLIHKGFLVKVKSEKDARSFSLRLTKHGEELAIRGLDFAAPFSNFLNSLSEEQKVRFYEGFFQVLSKANQEAKIPVERMCFQCEYYEGDKSASHYCQFLKQSLNTTDLRVDCDDFQSKD